MMKKIIAILLAISVIFCFTACGGSENQGEDLNGKNADIENPVTELDSLEALNEKFGCAMVTPGVMGVSDEHFLSYDGDPAIAEYQFSVNSMPYTLRFAVAGMETDISGYYRSGGEDTVFKDSDTDSSYYECNEAKLQRWFTIDGQYVLKVTDNSELDYETFNSIVEAFRSVKPVNWNDDGSFENYKALEGYYLDAATGSFASFSISGTQGRFMAMTLGKDATEKYEFDTSVIFDANGNLAFEKVGIKLYKSDESGVTVSEESLPDKGAGYFELKDGVITCTDSGIEELKDMIFEPYSF